MAHKRKTVQRIAISISRYFITRTISSIRVFQLFEWNLNYLINPWYLLDNDLFGTLQVYYSKIIILFYNVTKIFIDEELLRRLYVI